MIPLVENDVWFLIRVDVSHKRIWIADTRNEKVWKTCSMIQVLKKALKEAINAEWIIEYFADRAIPKCNQVASSAVLVCLNLTCFATFTSKRHQRSQKYAQVFGYVADEKFMKQARYFISDRVYTYAKDRLCYNARELV